MELTHFGHSCVQVNLGGSTVLFDPGAFSHGFEGITGLDAILITHQHPDHVDSERLPALLESNPGAALYADPQTAAKLGDAWTAVNVGDVVTVGSVRVAGVGGIHATIHPDIPLIDNISYILGTDDEPSKFMHPGDALFVPDVQVDVLAVPLAAPWMKLSEGVDYLRAVRPRIAVPIHDAVVADVARGVYTGQYSNLTAASIELREMPTESSLQV